MLFKPVLRSGLKVLFFCAGITALFSCGRLDDKPAADRTLLPGSDIGCYDQLGDRVSRYFDGNIEESEWAATFDCVKDQVTFFKKYVRGEDPNGYNRADIAALVRKFLIVERPVSDVFIGSLFEIKASAFGGSATTITREEIDEFLRLSEVLRKETTELLPILRARRVAKSPANLLRLADGLSVLGERVGNYLRGLRGSQAVEKESFLPFVKEILALHGGDPALVDKYGDFARHLKAIVAAGSSERIEAQTWPTIIHEGAAIGGLLFAYRDLDESGLDDVGGEDQFRVDLARRLEANLNRIIRYHGAGIPLELLDPVIDTAPFAALNDEKRGAIKHDLRQIVVRALRGGVDGWLTSKAVATLSDLYEEGMRSQMHVKRIYVELGPSPSPKEFEIAARRYLDHFGSQDQRVRAEVNSLIETAKTFIGLFPETTGEMEFSDERRPIRTRSHMMRMSWFRISMRHVLDVYGTATASGRKTGKVEDLAALTGDFHRIMLAWKLAHPALTWMEVATKRFREANLFMPSSDGDALMDEVEATYYIAFLFSTGSFSGRVYRTIGEEWRSCGYVGVDELGREAFSAACFRKAYFGNTGYFWKQFPGLQADYAKMSDAERLQIADSMETAARRGGKTENPIGPYDIDSFAGLPHYVESIMERFDVNDDEVLDKREILDRAYPVFRKTLAQAAGQSSDVVLRGILTYIVRHGEAPPSTFRLLTWIAVLPVSKVEANRNDLYRVVALLSSPLQFDKNVTGSSWPATDVKIDPVVSEAAQN